MAWGDYDNDGDLDILLTGLDASNNFVAQIYRNDGGGTFNDISAGLTGVTSTKRNLPCSTYRMRIDGSSIPIQRVSRIPMPNRKTPFFTANERNSVWC